MSTAALIILLLLLALLAVPVSLDYRFSWQRKLEGRAVLRWLFGLVRVQLLPCAERQPFPPQVPPAGPSVEQAKTSGEKYNPLPALRQKDFRQRLLRFARDLWRALHKRDLRLRVRIGLGDPADTGQLWALCGPLSGWLQTVEDASIELEPEFMDAVFEVDSSGRLSVIPLRLLYLALGLLVSPPFWRGLRQMRWPA
ncbi:MAG: DUF2953 domain-containing protein [Gammaproteobacteria bacterium]|nr:DUF2953 domain-containing protein [Gammaproteobacteria bacterium]